MLARLISLLLVLCGTARCATTTQLVVPAYGGTDVEQPSTSANVMRCFVWTPSMTITGATKITAGITTGAAAATCGLAIYPDDNSGSVIAGSNNACTAAGPLTMTISPSFQLDAGTPYRFCACSTSTTVRLLSAFDFSTAGATFTDVMNVGATRYGTGTSCSSGSPPPTTGALSAAVFQAFFLAIE